MVAIAGDVLDLVLPRRCVGCGARAAALCRRCGASHGIQRIDHGTVLVCAAAAYTGGVQKALIRYKERGRRDLAGPLAALLARAVREVLSATGADGELRPVLVGIPSTRAAAAARGGDHVARLARRAAVRCGVPLAARTLELTREKLDSAGLSIADRAGNVCGALRAGPPSPRRAAVLVDDIVTTGATLREAARALQSAGWPVLGAAVVAATPRRRAGTIGTSGPGGLA
ncbi:MAG TPA: phosphoribosyltransferase family protein [Jatrophihabitans sp.]|nr:phosphoribosyltransferase family protein [Jatrophihabitans sp.]